MPRLLTLRDVTAVTALSRSAVYALMAESRFPKPIRIGSRAVRWVEQEVFDFIASQPRRGAERPVAIDKELFVKKIQQAQTSAAGLSDTWITGAQTDIPDDQTIPLADLVSKPHPPDARAGEGVSVVLGQGESGGRRNPRFQRDTISVHAGSYGNRITAGCTELGSVAYSG